MFSRIPSNGVFVVLQLVRGAHAIVDGAVIDVDTQAFDWLPKFIFLTEGLFLQVYVFEFNFFIMWDGGKYQLKSNLDGTPTYQTPSDRYRLDIDPTLSRWIDVPSISIR